jgi:hypothetical protein
MGVSEGWTKYSGLSHIVSLDTYTALAAFQISADKQLLFAGNGPFWLAMRGYTYHRTLPVNRPNHPAHWFLYDASARSQSAQQLRVINSH